CRPVGARRRVAPRAPRRLDATAPSGRTRPTGGPCPHAGPTRYDSLLGAQLAGGRRPHPLQVLPMVRMLLVLAIANSCYFRMVRVRRRVRVSGAWSVSG